MKKIYLVFIFAILFLPCVNLGGFLSVRATEIFPDIEFPIVELGNCNSMSECKKYCDLEENAIACLDFAERHNLLPKEEIEKNKKMIKAMEAKNGPGGCQSQTECEAYCDNPEHMEECIIFGREHGLIPPEELKEAEQALQAIRKGVNPPLCQGKEACDAYCSQPENIEECIAFGEAAGFIGPEEAAMIRKTNGKGPGGCQGKEECDAYCENPEHMKECIEFGLENGLMPPKEEKEVRIMLQALEKGIKPPACKGEKECDEYCSQPEHAEECFTFAEAAGFMSPEEAEEAKKMAKAGIFGGPGGCKGKEECDAYCDNPEHMEECIDFSVKAGFMPLEEAEKMKKMGQMEIIDGPGGCQDPKECDAYCQNPDNMQECMKFGKKMGLIKPEEAEKIRVMSQLGVENGPGGCQTPQECKLYCDNPEHMNECLEFGQIMGLMKPKEIEIVKIFGPEGPGGPGGCRGKEECDAYCSQPDNMEECMNFSLKQGIMTKEEAEKMKKMMKTPEMMGPQPGQEMMMYPEGETPIIMPEGMKDLPLEEIEKIKQMLPEEFKEKLQFMSPEEIKALLPEGDRTMIMPGEPMESNMPPEGEMHFPLDKDKEIIKPPQGEMWQEPLDKEIMEPREGEMPMIKEEEIPMIKEGETPIIKEEEMFSKEIIEPLPKEETMPYKEEPQSFEPQSLLDTVKQFLAAIAPVF